MIFQWLIPPRRKNDQIPPIIISYLFFIWSIQSLWFQLVSICLTGIQSKCFFSKQNGVYNLPHLLKSTAIVFKNKIEVSYSKDKHWFRALLSRNSFSFWMMINWIFCLFSKQSILAKLGFNGSYMLVWVVGIPCRIYLNPLLLFSKLR